MKHFISSHYLLFNTEGFWTCDSEGGFPFSKVQPLLAFLPWSHYSSHSHYCFGRYIVTCYSRRNCVVAGVCSYMWPQEWGSTWKNTETNWQLQTNLKENEWWLWFTQHGWSHHCFSLKSQDCFSWYLIAIFL